MNSKPNIRFSALLIIMLYANWCAGQQVDIGTKPVFSSINTFALLAGSSGESYSLQTINGVAYKNWNVGLGIGIDWYGVRTVPLLLDVRRYFSKHAHKPFVYANGGVSLPWAPNNDGYIRGQQDNDYRTTGSYEMGIGYNLTFKNKLALVLSTGYSYKQNSYDQTFMPFTNGFPVAASTMRFDYYYRRIAIRMGLHF